MNENNVVDLEQSTEIGASDTESFVSDTEYSQDTVVDGSDSSYSDSDLSVMDTSNPDVESESSVAETVQNVNSDPTSYAAETETYYNSEYGGYPVVIVYDATEDYGTSLLADYEDYYTTLSTTWENYFSGVLANMADVDYVAYCLRDYASSTYSTYTDHFILYYDVVVENGELVSGDYPYMDIYRDSSSSGYLCSEGVGTLTSVPFPSYASFGNNSDLRKGVSHDETWAILFAIGFAVCYSVCSRIFDYVRTLRRGSEG